MAHPLASAPAPDGAVFFPPSQRYRDHAFSVDARIDAKLTPRPGLAATLWLAVDQALQQEGFDDVHLVVSVAASDDEAPTVDVAPPTSAEECASGQGAAAVERICERLQALATQALNDLTPVRVYVDVNGETCEGCGAVHEDGPGQRRYLYAQPDENGLALACAPCLNGGRVRLTASVEALVAHALAIPGAVE